MALAGKNCGHAHHRAQIRQALQMEGGRGQAQQGGQRREDDAEASFHHQGRLRHHQKCRDYLGAADQGEDYPPYHKNGLPKYVQLKNVAVPKKLDEFIVK
jgi:hypothetical protein